MELFYIISYIVLQEVNLAYENVKEVDGLDVSKEGSDSWEAAIKRWIEEKSQDCVQQEQKLHFLNYPDLPLNMKFKCSLYDPVQYLLCYTPVN